MAPRNCRGIMHVVKRGDTLYKLSRRYNVKITSIILANPYMNIYNLQVGDELCIPVAGNVRPPAPRPPVRPPQPAPAPRPPRPPVRPVPPIGDINIGTPTPTVPPVTPVTPVPPIGDLRPPTVIMPRSSGVESEEIEQAEPKAPTHGYDTIDYEYEKEQENVEKQETAKVEIKAETDVNVPKEEELKVQQTEEAVKNPMEEMLENLNGSLNEFNRYMKDYLNTEK